MKTANPISAFLAAWQPCYRHPARRARGFCDSCDRHFCRDCIFPDHVCSAPAPARAPAAGRRIFLAALLMTGTIGAATWTLVTIQPATETAPAGRSQAGSPAPGAGPLLAGGDPALPGPDLAPHAAPAPETVANLVARAVPMPEPAAAPAATDRKARPVDGQHAVHSFNRGSLRQPAVLLTFDAGSHSDGATEILDALAEAGVRTTFFLTGEFIRDHPDLVRRIVADDHEVGNHTDTHLHLTRWETERRHLTHPEVSRDLFLDELERTQAAYRAVTGEPMAPLWRAPYGEYNQEILTWAADAGWSHVGWTPTLDTLDWVADPSSQLFRGAEEIARNLLELPDHDAHGGHGAIVLMHLGSERPVHERLGKVLPRVLASYRSRGLQVLTASAMMKGS